MSCTGLCFRFVRDRDAGAVNLVAAGKETPAMTRITIDIGGDELRRLERCAADHGRSVEDEAREIIRTALRDEGQGAPSEAGGLGTAIHALFKPLGGVDLDTRPASECGTSRSST